MMTSISSPEREHAITEQIVRSRVIQFLLTSGTQFIDLLSLAFGEEGLALGFAFRDMVLDQEMPPAVWPLAEVVAALNSPKANGDGRAGPLAARRSTLGCEIDALGDGGWRADESEAAVPRAA